MLKYKGIILLTFGKYVEVYAANSVINNEECTTSTVALYQPGNLQNGWMFTSLKKGRVIHRHQWKKLQINQRVIKRVKELG